MSEQSDFEVYDPQVALSSSEDQDFQHYRRRVEKVGQNGIEGKWTDEESLDYIIFMDYHAKIFASKEKRKTSRIFKALSVFLKTRTPRQCRSHFQKIMSKFRTVKKVTQFYQREVGLLHYQQKYDSIVCRLKASTKNNTQNGINHETAINNVAIQTEPLDVRLSDLSDVELAKLVRIVQEGQKIQVPFWMPPFYQSAYPTLI